jgi:hypothetical protein
VQTLLPRLLHTTLATAEELVPYLQIRCSESEYQLAACFTVPFGNVYRFFMSRHNLYSFFSIILFIEQNK